MSLQKLIESKILHQVVASGAFGKNAECVKIIKDAHQGKDHFNSIIQFVQIEVKVGGTIKVYPVVCKLQFDKVEDVRLLNTDFDFFNEVLIYKELVTLLSKHMDEILPKFYFGMSSLKEESEDLFDVIIVENLIPKGYRQTTTKTFLDYDHCLLAFERLGRFHGASIRLKHEDPETFLKVTDQLKETRWLESKRYLNHFFSENAKRGIYALMKTGENLEILDRFLVKVGDVFEMMKDILKVNERSVLCHGDFCRNNMIFRYEAERPVDVKLYDLATARYTSPIIDISFYLFLNMSPELRRKHFGQDFLRIYLNSVQSVVGALAPSMDELWLEFQQKAVYGYILVSFFLPVLMEGKPIDLIEFYKTGMEENAKVYLKKGGNEATEYLLESVRDLINWGCLH